MNKRLQRTKKLFEDKVIGPESFAVDSKSVIYTGSADGKIWMISGEKAEVLTTTGVDHPDCGKITSIFSNTAFPLIVAPPLITAPCLSEISQNFCTVIYIRYGKLS